MNMFYYQSHRTKFFYSLSLFFLVTIFSCKKKDTNLINSYKIVLLEELVDGVSLDRTAEIWDCRFDDEFYFKDSQKLEINTNENSCFPTEGEKIEGFLWQITEIDSLSGKYLELNILLSLFHHTVHDSLTLGITSNQWLNRENQFYKIIEFGDERIIIQNADGVSEPKTENIWQLTLEKEQ